MPLSILSLPLLVLIPSLCLPVFLTDALRTYLCAAPSHPHLFLSTFYPQLVAGSRGGTWRADVGTVYTCSCSPHQATCHILPLTLHPVFDHTAKRETFLLLLDCTFKNPSLRPVCLCVVSDENSERFFPARSASSGIANSKTHTHTPSSLKHRNISFW